MIHDQSHVTPFPAPCYTAAHLLEIAAAFDVGRTQPLCQVIFMHKVLRIVVVPQAGIYAKVFSRVSEDLRPVIPEQGIPVGAGMIFRTKYEVGRKCKKGIPVIQNVEVSDFLPHGFELVSETEEDPPVGFEEQSSVKGGKAMKWIYNEVQPGQKVEIRFKIRALGEHDPKDVYRMLLG